MPIERDLRKEIIENARKDRTRLEEVAESLLSLAHKEGALAAVDPEMTGEAAAAVSEELSRVTDSLTKINAGLIELVKVDAKKEVDPKKALERERDKIFDEVEESRRIN
jgi:hypothetical protein